MPDATHAHVGETIQRKINAKWENIIKKWNRRFYAFKFFFNNSRV